ncbi:GNAT family N-acetyltransferase [Actinospongicola halichondriae]|uniref:GNAT family N-acetyltransferase n=1 Tax=Actinospongicola halichondriae TaxID=3236844 RepID=UPI003D3F9F4F
METERLVLRQWTDSDRDPFAELNADPVVMEHFPATLSRAESDAFVDRHAAIIAERGWGLWAVEVRATGAFIGFTGLMVPVFDADFVPCVEIGWRLAADSWGQGYATEAANAVLRHAFDEIGLDDVVSFTYVGNDRSRRVMEKIGLTERLEFDHPNIPGDPVERHVLYGRSADR